MSPAIEVSIRRAASGTGNVELVFQLTPNYATVLTLTDADTRTMHTAVGEFLAADTDTGTDANTDAARALDAFMRGVEFEPYKSAVGAFHRHVGDSDPQEGELLSYPDGSQLFIPTDGEAQVLSLGDDVEH